MTSLVVERVNSEAALGALGPEWRALEQSSGNTLPFRTHAWASAWWRHLSEHRNAMRDSLAMRAIRTRNGRLVGVAPLTLTERPGVGPWRTRTLHFIGADPNVTEVRGALFEPVLEGDCYRALQEELGRSSGEFDWMSWSGIEVGRGAEETLSTVNARWSQGTVCCVIDLPSDWETLRASLPRNLKESLRKCYNSLGRAGLVAALEVVSEKSRVPAALADFFAFHSARAALNAGTAHGDVFAEPACRAFLTDACERLADQGALRIFRLNLGGQLAATRVGFALGDGLYLYYSGYDPAFARYSVMTTAVAESIKWAIGQGLRQVNLSTGRDESKLRWRPREVSYGEALLFPSAHRGRALHAAMDLASRAVRVGAVRTYAARLGLARRAR